MNCRPGDLARIFGTHPALNLSDRIVKLADEPAQLLFGTPHWRLEEPVYTALSTAGTNVHTGERFAAGERCLARMLPDKYLRPIRHPGPAAVDEVVARLGAAPRLVDVRRRSPIPARVVEGAAE